VCRLFEKVDPAAAQAASAEYHALYERVARDNPGAMPPTPASIEYAKRIVECYPFHPRLLDTAQGRLGGLQEFNKSRGTLRLFARILRTIWERNQDLELLSAGDVDWSSDRIQADLLQRLNRDSFKAAVSADIEKHAKEHDGDAVRGVHVRAASALLLESIPMQSNSGLDPAELTLAVLRPDEAGPEPAEALDRLVGVCWHTYPMPGGRGWQFRYEPNIIKQIEERMSDIGVEDAKSKVLSETQGYFSGPSFKVAAWPANAGQVPESADLQLVLCESEKLARSVCAYADDSNPQAPFPRGFQNAILAVAPTGAALSAAVDRAQRLLAAEAIEREHRSGESSKLVRDQLQRLKPELVKQFRIQTCRAFDRVVLAGNTSYPLEEQFQVSEEQMLQRPQGQACLRKFLDEKGLIYQAGDALDVGRFLKDLLPGTTPLPDKPEVYTTRAVHERFLAAPKLRLLPDGGVVRQTLLKAVSQGKVVLRLGDGRAYDDQGCVEGPEGRRRRLPGSLNTLPLDDTVWVTPADSALASLWVKEDQPNKEGGPSGGGGDQPPPPPKPLPAKATATTWEQVIALSADRPLLELRLIAQTPAGAGNLVALSQPLGAESLSLSMTVSGELKDSGTVSFAASELKPAHPTKPLQIAQTLFNALGEGATYEAALALLFGPAGRTGLEAQLKALSEYAPEGVTPRAQFDKPVGGVP
ncbi:MAG: hypothetical protein HYW07_16200, partial [Candidatus Latescibacteria bacterium]|nr:hypothetical protein [Candidatus Latescibacterota bacterium]